MTREEILEKRRIEFEEWFALNYCWFIENKKEGYTLERHAEPPFQYIQEKPHHDWRVWNAALDSVVIELPEKPECSDEYDEMDLGYRVAISACEDLIKKQGYRTK